MASEPRGLRGIGDPRHRTRQPPRDRRGVSEFAKTLGGTRQRFAFVSSFAKRNSAGVVQSKPGGFLKPWSLRRIGLQTRQVHPGRAKGRRDVEARIRNLGNCPHAVSSLEFAHRLTMFSEGELVRTRRVRKLIRFEASKGAEGVGLSYPRAGWLLSALR